MIWSDKDRFFGLETPSMASLAAPWPAQAMPAPAAVPGGPRRARRRREALRSVHPSECCSSTSFQISDFARKFIIESTSSTVVPHKAVAAVSEIGNLQLRFPLFISLSFSFSDYLPAYLPTYLSIYLSICKLENKAILRHFLGFLNLTTSKTQQVSETSSVFALDNIKNEANLRDLLIFCTWQSWQHQKRSNSARLQRWKVERRADGLAPKRFAILWLRPPVQTTAPATKKWYGVIRSAAPVEDLMLQKSKMQPLSRNQRPDLLTSLMNMSLVLRLPRKMHLCRSSSNVPRLPSFLEMLQNHFWQGAQSLAPATRNDIWTSKSGPNPWCF